MLAVHLCTHLVAAGGDAAAAARYLGEAPTVLGSQLAAFKEDFLRKAEEGYKSTPVGSLQTGCWASLDVMQPREAGTPGMLGQRQD